MNPEAVVLDSIPFRFDEEQFCSVAHLDRCSSAIADAQEILERAVPLVRPKALYRVCYVEGRREEGVRLDGVEFRSRVLATNLAGVQRVFAYVATCGTELEPIQRSCPDVLGQYWLDALKGMALLCARQALREHVAERFALEPSTLCSMNPGSGDADLWPIAQQAPLFRLLGEVDRAIGVGLTDSFLMVPNKTVSGILFPAKVPFESCQLCSRVDCPGRRTPFADRREAAAPLGHA